MTERETVFLVDDDEAVRHALSLYLESKGFWMRSYASAEDLLLEIDIKDTGVLILDLRMKGMSGLELQAELDSRGVTLPIIFVSGHGTVGHTVRALKKGASDFIEKPFDNEVLLESIKSALEDERTRRELRFSRLELMKKFRQLTPREREVLRYIVNGTSNKEVADGLGLSRRTIEVHRARIMSKMAAGSLPELVRMAMMLESINS